MPQSGSPLSQSQLCKNPSLLLESTHQQSITHGGRTEYRCCLLDIIVKHGMDRRELRKTRDATETQCNKVNKNKNISTPTGNHRRGRGGRGLWEKNSTSSEISRHSQNDLSWKTGPLPSKVAAPPRQQTMSTHDPSLSTQTLVSFMQNTLLELVSKSLPRKAKVLPNFRSNSRPEEHGRNLTGSISCPIQGENA